MSNWHTVVPQCINTTHFTYFISLSLILIFYIYITKNYSISPNLTIISFKIYLIMTHLSIIWLRYISSIKMSISNFFRIKYSNSLESEDSNFYTLTLLTFHVLEKKKNGLIFHLDKCEEVSRTQCRLALLSCLRL